jgi:PAS domain S-box-containing protein
MNKKLKILHLEDILSDAELISRVLKRGNIDFENLVVDTKEAYINALCEFNPDIVLSDHSLPSFDSHEALAILQEKGLKTPLILVTATVSEEFAVDVIKRGAADYILKDRPDRLPSAIQSTLEKCSLEKQHTQMIYDQRHLADIVNTCNDGIISETLDGTITSWNFSAGKLLGYSAAEAIGKKITMIIPTDRLQEQSQFLESIKKGKEIQHFETVRLTKAGARVDVSLTISPLYDNNGKIIGIAKIVYDITERKKAEQQLADSEQFNKGILASLSSHIAVIDEKGTIITVNKAWDDFAKKNNADSLEGVSTGANYFDVCKKAIRSGDIIAKETLAGIEAIFQKEKEAFEIEYPCDAPNQKRWFTLQVMNFGSDSSKVVISHQDITARKLAEDKTIHATRLYAFISQINQTIVHVKDEQALFNQVCSIAVEHGKFKMAWMGIADTTKRKINLVASCGLSGHNIKMLTDHTYNIDGPIEKILQGNDYYVVNDILIEPGLSLKNYALEHGIRSSISLAVKKSGKVIGCFTIYSSEINFFDAAEIALLREATADISYALDVFEKDRLKLEADKKLAHSELRLKQAQAIAHFGNFELSYDTGIAIWSDEMLKIWGLATEDRQQTFSSWLSFVHPEDLDYVSKITAEEKETSGHSAFYHRIVRKDGTIRYIYSQAFTDFNKDGQAIGLYGAVHDVTEIKQAEETLRESENKLKEALQFNQKLIDASPMGIASYDAVSGECISANEALAKLIGTSQEEILKQNFRRLESWRTSGLLKDAEETVLSGKVNHNEINILTSFGNQVWMDYRLVRFLNNGQALLLLLVNEITERKQAEEKLRHSEQRLRQAQAIAHIGSWDLDFKTGISIWSDEQVRIFGLSPEENEHNNKTWSSFIHPEDVDYVAKTISETRSLLKSQAYFYRIIRRDGTVRHLHAQNQINYNAEGQPTGLHGVAQDVTETREAEIALQESESNLRAIFENTSDGFVLADSKGIIKSFNKNSRDRAWLNKEQEVHVGDSIYDFIDEPRKDFYRDNIARVLTGEIWRYDYSFTRKNAETKWYHFTVNPVYDGKDITGISITSADITQRKKAEENLFATTQRLSLATSSAKMGVWDWDIVNDKMIWDDTMYQLYGIEEKDFTGTVDIWQKGVHPDDIEDANRELNAAITNTHDFNSEFRVLWPDQSVHFIEAHALVIKDEAGNGIRMTGVNWDITGRKNTEEKVIQSEKHSRNLFEQSIVGLALSRMDGTLADVNEAYAKIIGRTIEETMKLTYWEITPEKYIERENEILKELSNTGKFINYEKEYIHKDGHLVPVRLSGNIIERDGERFIWSGIEDITEKKRLEKAVESERDQFFNMFLKAPSAIGMLKGANHVFEMVNPLYLQLIGKKDVIGKTVAEVLPEVIEQGFIRLLDGVYATGKSYIGTEALIKIDKEGNGELTDAYLNFIYQAYRNDEGNIEGIFFFANDITEQIQSRKEIEKSEKFFKGVIENSDDMITILDPVGKTLYASPAVSKKFGYTQEECLNLNLAEVVHPEDALIIHEFFMKIMTLPSVPMECPLIRNRKKDGTYIWVEGTVTNFLETEGINAIVANFRDITRRKDTEELIRVSQSNLEAIIENTDAFIYSLDTQLKYVIFNSGFQTLMKQNYGTDIKAGDNIFDFIYQFTPNDEQEWKEVYSKGLRGEVIKFEKEFVTANSYTYTSFSIHPIWENKNVIGLSCFVNDITKEKQDAIEKRNLEILLNKTNSLARIGNYELNLTNNTLYWSDITKQIHEVDPDFIPDVATAINFYKEGASREMITHSIQQAINKNIPFDLELQIVTAKGNELWVRAIGEAECYDGKCLRLYGSFQDIDAGKKADIEVLKAYEEKNIILESIGDGFYTLDKNWIITYWNNQAEKMLGRTKHEMLGKNFWDEYPDVIDTPSYAAYLEAVKENTMQHFEMYNERFTTWYQVSIYPSVNGVSVYFQDVTDRKLAEQQVRYEKNLLRTLIDNIPDSIYVKDTAAKKLISNKFDYIVLGADTEQEVLGKTDLEMLSHGNSLVTYNQDMEILRTGNPLINFEEYFTTTDNKPLWLLTSKLPLRNEDNKIIGLLGIGRDITQRKMAEGKLLELNAALQKNIKQLVISNAELEQFAYVASHDLQEPLRMITSFLTLLEKRYNHIIDEKGRQYIGFAVDGGIRMRQIITDLLEFSRVGRTEDKIEKIDLNELVNEILSLHSQQIKDVHAIVKCKKLPSLNTYKTPMRQVFQNLINNGLKYHRDGVAPEISISVRSAGKFWQFAVSDNGIGIGNAYLDKIFIIFQRLHNKDKYSGTGIGLSITKKIIESMGGSIRVESEEGKGSTFYFKLPKKSS